MLSFTTYELYHYAHAKIWTLDAGYACQQRDIATLEILITMCHMSWNREAVSCQGVTAVLSVTAVIIMQLSEGMAAKPLRLLPKHHNSGGSSRLVVMWLVQDGGGV